MAWASAPLGLAELDAALGGGLSCGAVHEVFASGVADTAAAAGFAIGLALNAAKAKPIIWVRQDFAKIETGELYAPGLAEMGLSPSRLILVRAHDAADALRAGEEAARCSPLGAVILEPWGAPRVIDLTASRRLALAAEASGVSLVMLRVAAKPEASAASTRWRVRSAPAASLEADTPGLPTFEATLLHRKAGQAGQAWKVEWNRDACEFRSAAPLSGRVAALPAGRPRVAPAAGGILRLAG